MAEFAKGELSGPLDHEVVAALAECYPRLLRQREALCYEVRKIDGLIKRILNRVAVERLPAAVCDAAPMPAVTRERPEDVEAIERAERLVETLPAAKRRPGHRRWTPEQKARQRVRARARWAAMTPEQQAERCRKLAAGRRRQARPKPVKAGYDAAS